MASRRRGSTRPPAHAPRRVGALLLECLLAIAIFVGAGVTILVLLDSGSESLRKSRLTQQGLDHARTALSRLEAGLAELEELNGVSPTSPQGSSDEASQTTRDRADQRWRLEVTQQPSDFPGLLLVTVRATYRESTAQVDPDVTVGLSQLVPLRGSQGAGDAQGL